MKKRLVQALLLSAMMVSLSVSSVVPEKGHDEIIKTDVAVQEETTNLTAGITKVMMEELAKEFTFKKEKNNNSLVDLSGKTFVITGSLIHYKNRDELVSVIESMGGKVSGSVSAKTSYLINNDSQSSSSKNQKAKQLNIPIISEEDFINMIS